MACGAAPGEGTEDLGTSAAAVTSLQLAQQKASLVAWAILGNNTAGLPASCPNLISSVQDVINGISAGTLSYSYTVKTIQGLPATEIRLWGGYQLTVIDLEGNNIFTNVNDAATACWGGAVADFGFTETATSSKIAGEISWWIDPAPVTLSANLGAAAGSAAAGAYTDGSGTATVYQLPNTSVRPTAAPPVGAPCTSIGQAAAQGANVPVTGSVIHNSGAYYQCSG